MSALTATPSVHQEKRESDEIIEILQKFMRFKFELKAFADNDLYKNNDLRASIDDALNSAKESAEKNQESMTPWDIIERAVARFFSGDELAILAEVEHFKNDANGNDHYLHTWRFDDEGSGMIELSTITMEYNDGGFETQTSDYIEALESFQNFNVRMGDKFFTVGTTPTLVSFMYALASIEYEDHGGDEYSVFFGFKESLADKQNFVTAFTPAFEGMKALVSAI
jgi:hypothetical protein